jgi:hypothetical protein
MNESVNKVIDDFRRRVTGREHEIESCCDGGRQCKVETEGVDLPKTIQPGMMVELTYPYEIVGSPIYKSDDPQLKQVGGEHYKGLAIEPVEYCQRNQLGYCESNAVKYVTRHRLKGGKQDLQKAIHYLELLLKLEYGG